MRKPLTVVGIILTATYLGVMGFALLAKWPTAQNMPLNEWGDFFAGAMAPVAFLWLVLGYFQQSEELRQNTDALRLQADQLRNQVEETRLLVQEASAQAKASAELAQYQAALLAHEERRALPRFERLAIDRLSWVQGDPRKNVIQIKFTNLGATATSMRVYKLTRTCKEIRIDPPEVLATSKFCLLTFIFEGEAPANLEFDMSYHDQNAIPRMSHFVVEGNACMLTEHGERP